MRRLSYNAILEKFSLRNLYGRVKSSKALSRPPTWGLRAKNGIVGRFTRAKT